MGRKLNSNVRLRNVRGRARMMGVGGGGGGGICPALKYSPDNEFDLPAKVVPTKGGG